MRCRIKPVDGFHGSPNHGADRGKRAKRSEQRADQPNCRPTTVDPPGSRAMMAISRKTEGALAELADQSADETRAPSARSSISDR